MVEKKKVKQKKEKKTPIEKAPVKKVPAKFVKKVEPKQVKKEEVQTKQVCTDKHCPIHSHLKVRGREFIGKVITDKMSKTIRVEWARQARIPKYERLLKKRSRVHAHNPPCISAKVGDRVRIGECRPISKTKTFVVLEVLK